MDSVMRTLLVLSAWLCVQGQLDMLTHGEDFQQATTCQPLMNQGRNNVIALQLRILIDMYSVSHPIMQRGFPEKVLGISPGLWAATAAR